MNELSKEELIKKIEEMLQLLTKEKMKTLKLGMKNMAIGRKIVGLDQVIQDVVSEHKVDMDIMEAKNKEQEKEIKMMTELLKM